MASALRSTKRSVSHRRQPTGSPFMANGSWVVRTKGGRPVAVARRNAARPKWCTCTKSKFRWGSGAECPASVTCQPR